MVVRAVPEKEIIDGEVTSINTEKPAFDVTVSEKKYALQSRSAQISAIAETIEAESNIETLVKSCGFEKCLAVINGESASVIVSAGEAGLAPGGVAQITAIVYEQAGILPANLTIIEK